MSAMHVREAAGGNESRPYHGSLFFRTTPFHTNGSRFVGERLIPYRGDLNGR
jgi:hypothetical protein